MAWLDARTLPSARPSGSAVPLGPRVPEACGGDTSNEAPEQPHGFAQQQRRAPEPPRQAHADKAYELRGAALSYLRDHPGCVHGGAERHRYTDAFRHSCWSCASSTPTSISSSIRCSCSIRPCPSRPTGDIKDVYTTVFQTATVDDMIGEIPRLTMGSSLI